MQHRLHHGELVEVGVEQALDDAGHGCLSRRHAAAARAGAGRGSVARWLQAAAAPLVATDNIAARACWAPDGRQIGLKIDYSTQCVKLATCSRGVE